MRLVKTTTEINDEWITSYAFWFLGKKWIVSITEKKWRKGNKFTKMPIWFSTIRGEIMAMFVWNIMIGFQKKKGDENECKHTRN